MASNHKFLRFLMVVTIIINLFTLIISSDIEYPVVRVLKSVDPNDPGKNSSYEDLNVSQNSDLLIESKVNSVAPTKLIFECRAPFLVQWLYTGLGSPEFSTNLTTISGHKEFIATMYLGFQRNLEEQDTGNYTCRSIRDSNISTYIYLFSPGASLFTTKGNENITYRETDEYVRIPCGLSQPNSSVTIQKSINGQLQCPMNDSISFDPKLGYILKLKEFSDPQGFYICSAGYNHRFQMIEYNLVLDESPGSKEDESHEATSTTSTTTTIRTTTISTSNQTQKCQINAECSSDTACIEENCVDPCTILCAKNSNCYIANHVPHCSCRNGYTGDPYSLECNKIETPEGPTTEKLRDSTTNKPEATSPCEPNPCGDKSICRYDGLRILCTCQSGYVGSPPYCRNECESDLHCPLSKACTVEKKCENPCRAGVCGRGAQCRTVNHYPVCNCPRGTLGDAYVDCRPESEINVEKPHQIVRSPCDSSVSPCGANTDCIVINNQAACRCASGFRGSPYSGCRVDGCNYNRHCSNNLACFVENGTCVDPCILKNPCEGRKCVVNKHIPVCLPPHSTPSSGSKESSSENLEACLSSPCGPNTICKNYKGAASCSCMPLFDGNPWIGCTKIKCRNDDSCKVGEKCVEGTCIQNRLKNDIIPEEYNDDQTEYPEIEEDLDANVCNATSCGHRAVCKVFDQMATCECIEPFKGNPYEGCELPCNGNSDCPKELSCSTKDNYCADPCQSKTPCGQNAYCNVINHKATCSCPDGYEGNPVVECGPVPSLVQNENITKDNESISDPCTGVVCDINQKCVLKEGVVICECNESFKMKLGKGCVPEQLEEVKQNDSSPVTTPATTPGTFWVPNYVHCHPLPCGSFAFCNEETDPKSCKCLPDYYGDPYSGCQKGIECESNENCSSEAACMNKKCIDPCKTIMGCGVNQVCTTENHDPSCRCKKNYQADATGNCQIIVTA